MRKRRNEDDDVERELEELEQAQDELEEIVSAAGERDGENYLGDLKIRARKAGGYYFLALRWYRADPPSASVVYPPKGWWMTPWYRSIDGQGNWVWATGLDRENE